MCVCVCVCVCVLVCVCVCVGNHCQIDEKDGWNLQIKFPIQHNNFEIGNTTKIYFIYEYNSWLFDDCSTWALQKIFHVISS